MLATLVTAGIEPAHSVDAVPSLQTTSDLVLLSGVSVLRELHSPQRYNKRGDTIEL